jgi:uncharacterized protein YkwD
VIHATAISAIERSLAVFVALAVQLVAVAVVGDVFAAAPRPDAGLPPPNETAPGVALAETVARVALVARGERLITFDLTMDLAPESLPALSAVLVLEPNAEPAPVPLAETAEEAAPEPAAPPIAEPTSAARPDPTPAATPRPAPAPPAITTSLTTQQAEVRMLALMNTSRLEAGLLPLAFDAGVSNAARAHSVAEAEHRYVYHDGPDGTARSRNAPACGSGWYGENTGKVWSGGVDALHREFMAEPWEPINHRTNIMDANFRRAGIGAVQGPDAVYVTVVFCR